MTARRALAAAALGLTLALAGCSTSGTSATGTSASETSTTGSSTPSAAVTVTDAWAKAGEVGAMTAMFATLHNPGTHDVTLVSASSPAAGEVQLHETSADSGGNMVMSEVDGGLVIPAGGSLALEPGGNHVMLMGLATALEPGADVSVTLAFDDGGTVEVTAPVKDFAGADETYHDGH